ncbi:MAG: hypothetical protein KF768_11705 [Phycisphaeraceae bacterium]|nr:hypothetical protein [Phycisphaeraceae bacterium]
MTSPRPTGARAPDSAPTAAPSAPALAPAAVIDDEPAAQPASQLEPKPAPLAHHVAPAPAEPDGVDHPLVKQAIDLFNAKVVAVQPRR